MEETKEEIVNQFEHSQMTKAGKLAMELGAEKKRLKKELAELQTEVEDLTPTTPVGTVDWYIKWVASAFVLGAMSIRGVEGLQLTDLVLSIIGISLWLVVSILWRDRALIMLNGAGILFLIRNLAEAI